MIWLILIISEINISDRDDSYDIIDDGDGDGESDSDSDSDSESNNGTMIPYKLAKVLGLSFTIFIKYINGNKENGSFW